MPNLMKALQTKMAALTAGNFPNSVVPKLFDSVAAQVTVGQLTLPYATAELSPGAADLTFESDFTESTRVKLSIFYASSADLDEAVDAIRWNGQLPSLNAGFDNGLLPALTGGALLAMLIADTPVKAWDGVDKNDQNVYRADINYDVMIELS